MQPVRSLCLLLAIGFSFEWIAPQRSSASCLDQDMSPEELETCLSEEKELELNSPDSVEFAIKYPVRITSHRNHYLIYKADALSDKKTSIAEVSSQDGGQIRVTTGRLASPRWSTFKGVRSIDIDGNSVVTWGVSSQDRSDASGAVGALAGGF